MKTIYALVSNQKNMQDSVLEINFSVQIMSHFSDLLHMLLQYCQKYSSQKASYLQNLLVELGYVTQPRIGAGHSCFLILADRDNNNTRFKGT